MNERTVYDRTPGLRLRSDLIPKAESISNASTIAWMAWQRYHLELDFDGRRPVWGNIEHAKHTATVLEKHGEDFGMMSLRCAIRMAVREAEQVDQDADTILTLPATRAGRAADWEKDEHQLQLRYMSHMLEVSQLLAYEKGGDLNDGIIAYASSLVGVLRANAVKRGMCLAKAV